MGYIVSTNKDCFTKPKEIRKSKGIYYLETDKNFQILPGLFLEGYLRKEKNKISIKNYKSLKTHWPLPDYFSGSFAFSLITDTEIILANDCIGFYTLYYFYDDNNFSFSNSLIKLQNALGLEIDEIGKAERLFGPENSEIGSRTLLKGVKRLLPGERLNYDLKTKSVKKTYDNRLYSKIHHNIDFNEINRYWQCLIDEIRFIESLNNVSTDIALSGGLDSRILIGAMSSNNNTIAYHYGKVDYYETKIAKKVASALGFKFKAQMNYDNLFPKKDILQNTIKKVGPPYSTNWYNILEMSKPHKTNLILGDMCEALHGRNINAFTSREERIKNYFKNYLLNNPYKFKTTNESSFEEWKSKKVQSYWNHIYQESLLSKSGIQINNFRKDINNDLNEIFERIKAHNLPFIELYDEIFAWFTHSRVPMGKQITHCNEKFFSYAPTMSSKVLISTSNIHPNLRLNYRFQNKIFKNIRAFKDVNLIPTNQAPLISRNLPDFVQFFVWGIRSKIDQILIKRILKNKNPSLRYRLFKSLDWVKIYQYEFLNERLDTYFENNYIPDAIKKACINLALSRSKLEEWPLANYDIMSIAVLNLELELLNKAK